MKRSGIVLLSVGITLALGTFVVDAGTAAAAPSTSSSGAPSSANPASEYTVRPGDSLVGIANRYGVRVWKLLQANELTITDTIHPGDVLTLPDGAALVAAQSTSTQSTSTPSMSTPSTSTPSAAAAGTTSYVVQAGDALALIARHNGVTLSALLRANDLTIVSLILPGRTLVLPPATLPIPAPIAPAGSSTSSPSVASSASTASAAPAPSSAATVVSYLRDQVGKPYQFFAAGPDAFDCSGLVVAAYRQAGITTLPHQSLALSKVGTAVDWTTTPIAAGDLVFTASTSSPGVVSHVGIALDGSTWIQAVGVGQTVRIGSLPADGKILGVRRVL